MSLSDWERNGWLVQHRTNRKEIADLLGLVDRDLRDRAAKGLSEDWQLAIAYNALAGRLTGESRADGAVTTLDRLHAAMLL